MITCLEVNCKIGPQGCLYIPFNIEALDLIMVKYIIFIDAVPVRSSFNFSRRFPKKKLMKSSATRCAILIITNMVKN